MCEAYYHEHSTGPFHSSLLFFFLSRKGAYIIFIESFLIFATSQQFTETHHPSFHSAKSTLKSGARVSVLCLRSASAMYHLEQHLEVAATLKCWLKYIDVKTPDRIAKPPKYRSCKNIQFAFSVETSITTKSQYINEANKVSASYSVQTGLVMDESQKKKNVMHCSRYDSILYQSTHPLRHNHLDQCSILNYHPLLGLPLPFPHELHAMP